MKIFKNILPLFLLSAIPLSCGSSENRSFWPTKEFGDYWYQGKAEITSYYLTQARYGALHEGHAVLIFVTEDFSKAKQVKLDGPQSAGDDAVKVLKLNFTKKFTTGIYPYSMMASVFTPVDQSRFPHTLKVTATSQEWCGQTFSQFNLKENGYQARLFSYFEQEGDRHISLPKALLEDEIWNLIRLSPDLLPTGEIQLVAGTLYQRLSHEKIKPQKAHALLSDHKSDNSLQTYRIDYRETGRTLTIHFKKQFPHEINGWEETIRSENADTTKVLTTTASLKKRIMTDYWTKNRPGDGELRTQLGL